MLYIILMCVSHLMFFLPMTYCLLFILYLFWTREMMLGKKKIQAIFLPEFKMGHKAAETIRDINNTFGPGTSYKHSVQ